MWQSRVHPNQALTLPVRFVKADLESKITEVLAIPKRLKVPALRLRCVMPAAKPLFQSSTRTSMSIYQWLYVSMGSKESGVWQSRLIPFYAHKRTGVTMSTKLAIIVSLALMPAMACARGIPQIGHGAPIIHGHPVVDAPHMLMWPRNAKPAPADLTDPAADLLFDLHGDIRGKACRSVDLVVSTEGNYHMALNTLWHTVLLPRYGRTIRSWYYTTSPPVALPQIAHSDLSFGNFYLHCMPSVAIAAPRLIHKLEKRHFTEGRPIALMKSRGNVLLVKYGNPLHIHNIWDLGRPNVHLVTPNPYNEPGAFLNYASSIYEIAKHDPHPPKGWTANRLFNAIFNSRIKDKWLIGDRIHHRDEPWSVAYGKADVAVIMYQLGKYTKASFPHTFTLIPLGGTLSDPRPLPGNEIDTTYLIKIKGRFTARQRAARRDFIKTMESHAFTRILEKDGLSRP